MRIKAKATERKLSEREIDEIVSAEADDESAWEEPIQVHKIKPTYLSIPSALAARAAFLAKLHREKNLGKWLTRIIQERIEIEEIAFAEAKREINGRIL